jgi:hypothetical protein
MKLVEIHNTSNQFFTTYAETKNWLDQMQIKNYMINPTTLEVDVARTVDISKKSLHIIPVKFNLIESSFNCYHNSLTTLQGAPNQVLGNFDCSNNKLTTLQGTPKFVGGDFYCYDNKLNTLQNINKHLKSVKTLIIQVNVNNFVGGLLSVMLIEDLNKLVIDNMDSKIQQACKIINKHLQGDRSITDCQIELQDAGLSQYAKL